jgi:hypothetical protein
MKTAELRIIGCSALLAAVGVVPWSSGQNPSSKGAAPRVSGQMFAEPILVKGPPINLRAFDAVGTTTSRNGITWPIGQTTPSTGLTPLRTRFSDSSDAATTPGAGRVPANPKSFATVPGQMDWSPTTSATHGLETETATLLRPTQPSGHLHHSIDPHWGQGPVDELAYDPINRILYAENDGDTPPNITFVSVADGSVLGRYVYPMDQDGMEQPA